MSKSYLLMHFRIFLLATILLFSFSLRSFAAFPVHGGGTYGQIKLKPDQAPSSIRCKHSPYLNDDHGTNQKHYSFGIALLLACPLFPLAILGLHDFYLGYKSEGNTHLTLLAAAVVFGTIGLLAYVGTILLAESVISLLIYGAAIAYEVNNIWAIVDFFRLIFGSLKPASGYWANEMPYTGSNRTRNTH